MEDIVNARGNEFELVEVLEKLETDLNLHLRTAHSASLRVTNLNINALRSFPSILNLNFFALLY